MNEELYKITPLEKKSIFNRIDVYRQNDDDSISGFTIEEHYRWGQGYVDSKDYFPVTSDSYAYCDSQIGWGAELDDHVAFFIEFTDDLSEEEREEIEKNYLDDRAGWLYDGDHNWEIEEDTIVIMPPYRIDKVDTKEYGKVLEENIKIE